MLNRSTSRASSAVPGALALPAAERARPRPSYLLLLGFVVLLYASLPLLYPSLELLRPAQLVAGAAIAALFVERAMSAGTLRLPAPESYLMIGFVAAAGISCFDALWPRFAVESFLDLLKMSLVYFLIVSVVDDERRVGGMFWALSLGGLFPAIGALVYHSRGVLVEEERAAWVGVFANPNDLAYSLVLLVPIAAAIAARRGALHRAAGAGIAVIFLAAIWISFSRGGLLGLFAALAVLTLRQRSGLVRALGVLLLGASVTFATYYWTREEGFADLTRDQTFQSRLDTMRAGMAMFADRPLTGVGLNCSAVAWPLYAPGIRVGSWLHNHNTFTQVLSETGILGALPYFGLIVLGTVGLGRSAREGPAAPYAAALQASLVGLVVCGLAGGYVMSWFPYLLLGLAASVRSMAD